MESQSSESRRPAGTGFRRSREFVSAYLVGFLLTAAVSPHRHKNDIADLLTDGPSDSGVFLDVSPAGPPGAPPLAETLRWTDDDPCLACFPYDFTLGGTEAADALPTPLPVLEIRAIARPTDRLTLLRFPISRAPPPLA